MIQPTRLGRPVRAALATAMVIIIAQLLVPPVAFAHRDPTIAVKLSEVRPALPAGTQIKVLDGDRSFLSLTNSGATPVVALDPSGAPFLQVSSEGVYGDVESTYLAYTGRPGGAVAPVKLPCSPHGRWMRLSERDSWAWPDPRLDPPQFRTPDPAADRGLSGLEGNRPLAGWEVELRSGDETITASGVLERRRKGMVRTKIENVPPGMTASIIESRPPQIRITVPGGSTATVLNGGGAAFLRVNDDGGFIRSDGPEYRAHRRAIGLTPKSAAGWVPMSSGGPDKVTWADQRLDFTDRTPGDGGAEPVDLGTWRIPLDLDGKRVEVTGTTSWEAAPVASAEERPKESGVSGFVSYSIAGALSVVLAGAFLLARRRAAAQSR